MADKTTIEIKQSTRDAILCIGKMHESFDDVVARMVYDNVIVQSGLVNPEKSFQDVMDDVDIMEDSRFGTIVKQGFRNGVRKYIKAINDPDIPW